MTHLSEAILNGTRGLTILSADPLLVSCLRTKADFLVIDVAARDIAPETLAMMVLAAGETPILVRTADGQSSTLQKYLNAGVDGLILTNIQYASEAEKAVAACLYPPEGVRSYTPTAAQHFIMPLEVSLQAQNDQLTLLIEVAHPQTAAQIDEIADVTGIDGLLLNPRKLAVAMERGFDVNHPDVLQALEACVNAADNLELYWGWEGMTAPQKAPAFQLVCSDMDLLAHGIDLILPEESVNDDEEDATEAGLRAVR